MTKERREYVHRTIDENLKQHARFHQAKGSYDMILCLKYGLSDLTPPPDMDGLTMRDSLMELLDIALDCIVKTYPEYAESLKELACDPAKEELAYLRSRKLQ